MEIKLKAGDSLNIPEGCKVVIKDNVVVFEREFQDGDVLHSIYDCEVLIFKNYTDSIYFSSHYNYSGKSNDGWRVDCFRHATEEEKQTLFDKMREQGLRWNAEEKRVEKIRWRAKKGENYHFLNVGLSVVSVIEANDAFDKKLLYTFNYFRTVEQTEEAVRRVKETLRKYHEELGE